MPENTTRDTVILGSGCSGLTAAIYSARSNLKPLVLEGHEPDLLACADALGVPPARLVSARAGLEG